MEGTAGERSAPVRQVCDTMSPPQLAALGTIIATRLPSWVFLGKLMEVGSHLPQKKSLTKKPPNRLTLHSHTQGTETHSNVFFPLCEVLELNKHPVYAWQMFTAARCPFVRTFKL